MNKLISIEEFLKLAAAIPIIDVRSPGEYDQGHIPGAFNIPLFSNEERAIVGTAYKKIGRQEAIKIGLELVGPKLKLLTIQAEEIIHKKLSENNSNEPRSALVHCWRGGMRSLNFAWLLNLNGIQTHTLIKGYKSYRNLVLNSFNNIKNLVIIGGETGSGKTETLNEISKKGEQVIDLESIACHKGSAFGSLGEKPQPTQEQFENELAFYFNKIDSSRNTWIEDESLRIGRCQLPINLWSAMKNAPILRLSIPKDIRIERLIYDYGSFSKEELAICIRKISKRLGPQHAKQALEELDKGNLRKVVNAILVYYDKAYQYNHDLRKMKNVFLIESNTVEAEINSEKLITMQEQIHNNQSVQ